MVVPPGKYQVVLRPFQFGDEQLRWPKEIEVAAEKSAVLKLDGGIRIVGPADAKPEFDFQIIDPAKKMTVLKRSQTWAVQLLPPGTYRVEVRSKGNGPWQVLADQVQVEGGRILEVKMPALPAKK